TASTPITSTASTPATGFGPQRRDRDARRGASRADGRPRNADGGVATTAAIAPPWRDRAVRGAVGRFTRAGAGASPPFRHRCRGAGAEWLLSAVPRRTSFPALSQPHAQLQRRPHTLDSTPAFADRLSRPSRAASSIRRWSG